MFSEVLYVVLMSGISDWDCENYNVIVALWSLSFMYLSNNCINKIGVKNEIKDRYKRRC
ncbi:hypothetical protein MNV_1810013 [Candidatus Methanoperedens nitroreducens]|uniref:Uncharacterized protein n=1 Tax=Candidatus Methanoperedens nitratireducens TaxID=1392998 RepID=A0A284VMN0_9EURY|nr:hypothetical protein MNV_1810013 [Candidatus Methanoperedens nitroreducens]